VEKGNFVDYIRIFCRSGKGGAGSSHFARTKYNPKRGLTVATAAEAAISF